MNGKQLKNSILQWAIQGKLVPQDPNDEPASVLLERIREEKARLVKEKKIKKDKNESIIFRGDDNSYYEKFLATGEVKCIDEEIPFEIPEGWSWVRLGSIIDFSKSSSVKPNEIEQDAWVLDLEDIEKDTGVLLAKKRMKDIQSKSDKHIFYSGNVLYSKLRPYLNKVIIADENGYCTSEILAFDFGMILNKYAQIYLMSPYFVDYAMSDAYGVKMPRLGSKQGNNALMPLPPFNEQVRIAAQLANIAPIVNRYAASQSELDRLNAEIFERLKKSVLQESIQGKLVPQNPDDEPASVLLERIKTEKAKLFQAGKLKNKDLADSTIYKSEDNKYYEKVGKEIICIDEEIPFDIPESWTWARVKDIFIINPKNTASDDTQAAFIPMEKISATYDSAFTYDIVKWGTIKKNFTHIADGDVAFAKITPCFQNRKSAIFEGLPNGIGAATTELKVLRQYGDTINRWYLLYFLESPYFIDEAKFKGTANQQRIISGYLENKLFPLPPKAEQDRIAYAVKQTASIMSR